ncbi:ATP-binding protein [Streptomyces adonidis]|uniref:ATP-binding protein n=1 Tax=Streptomyces adonidis TaxID=3231367 RepID=UPI0034DAF7AB
MQDQDEVSTLLSACWTDAVAEAGMAMARGQVVAVVGEPGTGRTALASLARRETQPRGRVLCARPPTAADIESWLTLWVPELHKDRTCVVVAGVDPPRMGGRRAGRPRHVRG